MKLVAIVQRIKKEYLKSDLRLLYRGIAALATMSMLFYSFPVLAIQSCASDVYETAPDKRFLNNADGTITDSSTGLMWSHCTLGKTGSNCATATGSTYDWSGALQAVEYVNSGGFAGYSDWRLPNIKELLSLVERSCFNPAINSTLFPNTIVSNYWSSSPHIEFGASSWGLNFYSGTPEKLERLLDIYYIRLVRN